MKDHTAAIRDLLDKAECLELSPTLLAILEEAVRLADLHQDVVLGIEARTSLMYVARNLLRGDILAAAFVWCLGQYDRRPDLFAGRNLLTEQRWVIGQLANTDSVARARLEEMLADYERRLQAGGFSRRNYYFTQRSLATDLGDRHLVIEAHREVHKHPIDALSVDPLWDLGEEMLVEQWLGHDDRAMQLARPLLEDHMRGYQEGVCAYLLLPLLKRGELAQAKRIFARCLGSCRPEKCYYWWYGEMLKFAAMTNDLGTAGRIYERNQRAIDSFTDPLTRLHFAVDSLVFFDCLIAAGKEALCLRLPRNVPVPRSQGCYEVAALRTWLGREAAELGARFDARNGNSYFHDKIQTMAELTRWAIRHGH